VQLLQETTTMIETLEVKIDKTSERLETLNTRLKKVIIEVRHKPLHIWTPRL
jgi:hypothetical protein